MPYVNKQKHVKLGHTAKNKEITNVHRTKTWVICACSVLVLVVRCTFGSRAEIVLSVLFSFDEGKFVRFQTIERLKIRCRINAGQRSVPVRVKFVLRSLRTLYMCASHSPIVLFVQRMCGACLNRLIDDFIPYFHFNFDLIHSYNYCIQ